MPITLGELLQPQVILDTVSKVSAGKGVLSRFFGMHIGGKNIKTSPSRYAQVRVINNTREPANFRAPGTGPSTTPPNPIGLQRVAMARVHEKITLDGELLSNLATTVGPNSVIDREGQDYIAEQEEFLGQKFNCAVEVMVAGMVQDSLYIVQSGDKFIPYLSSQAGTQVQINFQVPSGNKNQLNMLGTGYIIGTPWNNAAATIVQDCLNVRKAYVQLTGMQPKYALLNSSTLAYIMQNTELRTVGGTVQAVFDSFMYEDTKDKDGYNLAEKGSVRFRALPWLQWVIIDDVLSIGGSDPVYSTGTGTLTNVTPNDTVIFLPEPDPSWVPIYHGSELIYEDRGKPMTLKTGFQSWRSHDIEPTRLSIVGLLNAIPFYKREKA